MPIIRWVVMSQVDDAYLGGELAGGRPVEVPRTSAFLAAISLSAEADPVY